ncbi:Tetratricopeptide TPR_1 repeat-containing protein [Cyanobacterium stanieri PCC 7202]|uniref:Tetratricopeptide TPR_1 repeat-containing protein n=1 Tax=Cyanobacterium stanieri (strain ATCC 29140 / PCC 7202) TaxID=292563 RepID=K9YQ73_CYASC|nr:Tetratricopeptide TPR_1 repeat-containing protein [Cyanobacterium stanieri PCC 7202]
MGVIFLAQCLTQEKANSLAQYYDGLVWKIRDDITSKCEGLVKQDFEGNWWGCVLNDATNWTAVDVSESNYRVLIVEELHSLIKDTFVSAPPFEYGMRLDIIKREDLDTLLTDSSYKIHYSYLISEKAQNEFGSRLTTKYHVDLILSESFWTRLNKPQNFEFFVDGYVYLEALKEVISGDIKAPPKDVLEGKTMRVSLDYEKADSLYKKALDLRAQRKFIDALDYFNQAQILYPFSPAIHLDKAITLFTLNRLSEALSSCDSCLILKPNIVKDAIMVRQLKGDILSKQGKLEEALNFFDEALSIHPNNHHNFQEHYYSAIQKAEILNQLGRKKEALDACNLAVRFNPYDQSRTRALWSKIISQ